MCEGLVLLLSPPVSGLFEFYRKHNPEKANEVHVAKTLSKYAGREQLLVEKLMARYPHSVH